MSSAPQFDNTNIRRRNPIRRNNKFFGNEDFNFISDIAKEYIECQANQSVVLYAVDLNKTVVNDTYKEATPDAIRFKAPIELPVVFEIDDAELKTYNTKQLHTYYVNIGKLTFGVLISTLEDYGCDIKRGDYIGIQVAPEEMYYWTVADDGKIGSYSNGNTLYGTKPYMRIITCAPVDRNEMNG